MRGSEIDEAMAGIRAGLAVLSNADLSGLTSPEVVDLLDETERVRRGFDPVDQQLLAEVVTRGIAGDYARTSPTDLLVHRLHVRPGEARARVARAAQLGPRRDLAGQLLVPVLPDTAAALGAGEISGAHVDVIITALRHIPEALGEDAAPLVERTLLDIARRTHPGQVEKAAVVLLDRLDPDGREPREEELQRQRGFGLRKKACGGSVPFGFLTPELTARLDAVFDSLAAPDPAADGTPDPRTADQRRHDALLDATDRLMRADLPHTGGTPVTLSVIMRLDDFIAGSGTARTSYGDRLAVADILTRAADADILPIVLNDAGGILSYGKRRRLASCDQRRVLAARDRGCSFPGCTKPPAWCQTHHVIDWRDALFTPGATDIDNMTLLCGYHHRHFEALGWSCHMSDGVPLWTPPAWLDPEQEPIANTANHIAITFDTDTG